MIRGFSHPPPRHHPPQQLPHATFEPHHRTVVVRGVKERSTLAQRMSSSSSAANFAPFMPRVSTEAVNKIGIIVSLLIIFFSSAECIRNTNGLIVFISTTETRRRPTDQREVTHGKNGSAPVGAWGFRPRIFFTAQALPLVPCFPWSN